MFSRTIVGLSVAFYAVFCSSSADAQSSIRAAVSGQAEQVRIQAVNDTDGSVRNSVKRTTFGYQFSFQRGETRFDSFYVFCKSGKLVQLYRPQGTEKWLAGAGRFRVLKSSTDDVLIRIDWNEGGTEIGKVTDRSFQITDHTDVDQIGDQYQWRSRKAIPASARSALSEALSRDHTPNAKDRSMTELDLKNANKYLDAAESNLRNKTPHAKTVEGLYERMRTIRANSNFEAALGYLDIIQ